MAADITFDHCIIHVGDWARSTAFYRDVLDAEVMPGNSDLCFEWHGAIEDAIVHLETHKVAVELGPVERRGAKGVGTSVYFRDPDGSLLEFICYPLRAS